jgi:hypothetical protein
MRRRILPIVERVGVAVGHRICDVRQPRNGLCRTFELMLNCDKCQSTHTLSLPSAPQNRCIALRTDGYFDVLWRLRCLLFRASFVSVVLLERSRLPSFVKGQPYVICDGFPRRRPCEDLRPRPRNQPIKRPSYYIGHWNSPLKWEISRPCSIASCQADRCSRSIVL